MGEDGATADAILVQSFVLDGSAAPRADAPRVAIKDSIDIAGMTTRGGSRLFADAPPASEHADVARALLDAGCRIVGKANMHELAYGVTGINGWTGTPRNPRWPDRIPGGSSSGSAAAVAAGLCDFALGTDTGGSIRVPAACCGVYGLKPSFGRISRRGVMPAESSLDCVGPFARDLATIERAMAMLDPGFAVDPLDAPPRLGWVAVDADAEVKRAVDGRLAASGCMIVPVALPGMAAAFDAGLTIIAAETFAAYGMFVDASGLGADIRERLGAAGRITPDQLDAAEGVRADFAAAVDAVLAQVDALVLPTMPGFPPTLAEAIDPGAAIGGLTGFVRPFNLSGHPALTMPVVAANGLPAGIQLVGRRGGDAALCAVARWLEIPGGEEDE